MTIDDYLNSKRDPGYDFALGLVKRGTCFIAVKNNDSYRFYPSRFIGYVDNDMYTHIQNETKDGGLTNPAITSILGKQPVLNIGLEQSYRDYCDRLGFEANEKGSFGGERKYWEI